MPGRLSLKQGEELVKLARKSVNYTLASGRGLREMCDDKLLFEPRGVFVTLHSFPGKELRGCIGMPYPLKSLWNAVSEMAVESALNDPRFPPMKSTELNGIIVEVSVLTVPEEMLCERKKLPKFVKIGEDGLIVQRGRHSGLLLPQVATEQGWDAEEFLEQCCAKAGLMESMWQSKETHVFKFQAQVFSETEPEGEVEERTG
ncbi:MAG: TIGR00296 family protein [archaeon]